jgi:hypothetical protein
MPINFNLDLAARRKERQALDALEKIRQQQQQAFGGLTTQLFGAPTEGPPTAAGIQSRIGGIMPGGPQANLAELQMASGVPEFQSAGFTSAQQQLEAERQRQLQQAQQSQLQQALTSPALQATPELQAISQLIGAGASPDVLKAFQPQLAPFTLGEGRFTGTGKPIALAPEDAAKLDAQRAKLFDQATKLRGEFTGITKPFEDQNQAYGRVIASAQDSSPAGDLALIFNFMKVLDPGSTVREGEFAQVGAAGGLPTQVQRLFESWVTGKKLTPEQRSDVVGRAGKLFEQASKQHKKTAEEFRNLAKRQGIDPKNVIFQRQTIEPQISLIPPPPGFVENQ